MHKLYTSLSDIVLHIHSRWPNVSNVCCSRRLKWERERESMNSFHRIGWVDGWLWLSWNIQMRWIVVVQMHVAHGLLDTRALAKLTTPTTDNTTASTMCRKKLFAFLPYEFSHRHTMTLPHDIKEEKSWSPLNEMERNVNRGIWKLELFGFWWAHTRTRFAPAAVFLGYRRVRKELGIKHNSKGARMSRE